MALIGSLLINLGLKSASFDKKIKRSRSKVGRFAKGVKTAARRLAKFGVVAAAAGLAIGGVMVKAQLEAVDTIGKMSDELAISTEALVGFQHAAELTGSAIEIVRAALRDFVKRLGESRLGTGEAIVGLQKLGLGFDNLISMSTEKALFTVIDQINRLPDLADRIKVADLLFGGAGVELLNFISLGSRGLMAIRRETDRLNLSMSRVEAKQIERANDALRRMKAAITGVVRQFTIQLAPVIQAGADAFTRWATQGKGLGKTIASAIEEVIVQVVVLTAKIGELIDKAGGLKRILTPGGRTRELGGNLGRALGKTLAVEGRFGIGRTVQTLAVFTAELERGSSEAVVSGATKRIRNLFASLRAAAARAVGGVSRPPMPPSALTPTRPAGSFGVLDRARVSLAGLAATVIDPQKAEQIRLAKLQLAALQSINRGQGLN